MDNQDIPATVSQAHAERATIEGARARLAELEKRLLALAPGKYQGTQPGEQVQVIQPAPSLKPSPEAIEFVRAQVEPDEAKRLFERVVSYKPVKSFRDIARAILTKAKAAKSIAACEVLSAPCLRWN